MLNASASYKEQMNKPIRNRAYVSVSLGIVNQSAQADARSETPVIYFSNGNIFENQEGYVTYATMEQDYLKVDGSLLFPPENNGIVTAQINGITVPNIGDSFRIDFGAFYDIKGLTIDFGDAYPTSFTVQTNNGVETYSNNNSVFVTEDVQNHIDYMIITPVTMVGGQQRLHIRSILMGVGLVFGNSDTQNIDIEQYVSAISEEVSYTNYNVSIFDKEHKFDIDNDNSFMAYLEPMQPIKISFGIDLDDNTTEWHQVANGYLREWQSQKGILDITATDRLSQLEEEYEHNVLTDRTAYAEFVAILTDCGFESEEYEIDDFLQNVIIHNPMPRGAHRECLQTLANACRCIIYEDENGVLHVRANFENVLEPDELIVQSNDKTSYSKPKNILNGAEAEYADMSADSMSADGHTYFLPENGSNYLETGYVSNSIANSSGTFSQNPYVEIVLPARYSYYGVEVEFGNNIPQEVIVKTYNNATLLNTYTFTDLSKTSKLLADFENFNKIRIEVSEIEPNARVLINHVKFGTATDFTLSRDLMLAEPKGYREQRVKSVKVKIYTYQNSGEKIQEVDDDVYYTYTLADSGVVITCENPLIHNQALAEDVGEWLGNYYRNNVSYSVSYRGEPRIQARDIITMESEFKNNLQVEVQKAKLTFNGAFRGELDMRRALNMNQQT